jgi:hypothetical protein
VGGSSSELAAAGRRNAGGGGGSTRGKGAAALKAMRGQGNGDDSTGRAGLRRYGDGQAGRRKVYGGATS